MIPSENVGFVGIVYLCIYIHPVVWILISHLSTGLMCNIYLAVLLLAFLNEVAHKLCISHEVLIKLGLCLCSVSCTVYHHLCDAASNPVCLHGHHQHQCTLSRTLQHGGIWWCWNRIQTWSAESPRTKIKFEMHYKARAKTDEVFPWK